MNKKRFLLFGFAVLLMHFSSGSLYATLSSLTATMQSPPLSFKTTALVSKRQVFVTDLLISSVSEELKETLAQIEVAQVKEPLAEVIISADSLKSKLGSMSYNANIPDVIKVRRSGTILKAVDLREKILTTCNDYQKDAELSIDTDRIPPNIILPGKMISWNLTSNSNNSLGMRLFTLNVETDAGPFKTLLQVNVKKLVKAAELRQLAKPGQIITKEIVKEKEIEIKNDRAQVPLRYEEVLGKSLLRFKSAGTIIRQADITDSIDKRPAVMAVNPPKSPAKNRSTWLINPGEHVEAKFSKNNFELSFPAKAVQGGGVGDTICLINLHNQKRIQGVITDAGKVQIAQN